MKADEGDDNAALQYHEQALTTILDHTDLNDPMAASYFNNVAISSAAVGQYTQAIERYQKAIDLEIIGLHSQSLLVLLILTKVWVIFCIILLRNIRKHCIVMSAVWNSCSCIFLQRIQISFICMRASPTFTGCRII